MVKDYDALARAAVTSTTPLSSVRSSVKLGSGSPVEKPLTVVDATLANAQDLSSRVVIMVDKLLGGSPEMSPVSAEADPDGLLPAMKSRACQVNASVERAQAALDRLGAML